MNNVSRAWLTFKLTSLVADDNLDVTSLKRFLLVFCWDFLRISRSRDIIVKTVKTPPQTGAVEMFRKQSNYTYLNNTANCCWRNLTVRNGWLKCGKEIHLSHPIISVVVSFLRMLVTHGFLQLNEMSSQGFVHDFSG